MDFLTITDAAGGVHLVQVSQIMNVSPSRLAGHSDVILFSGQSITVATDVPTFAGNIVGIAGISINVGALP